MSIHPSTAAVIIPTLNAAGMLERALRGLAKQTVDYEALVVDGGSSDETVNIASGMRGVRVISAPGTSIYEAINRGIAATHAPAICLLNADDELLPGALVTFAQVLADDPKIGIVRGWPSFAKMGDGGTIAPYAEGDRRTHRALTLQLLLRGSCAINSLCIRRTTFEQIGVFDTAYRLAADREWMLRAWRCGIGISELGRPVYRYLMHDGSKTLDHKRRNYAEIRREHLAIVTDYLAKDVSGSNRQMRAALERWHAAETAMLFGSLARHRSWREASRVMGTAFQVRPLWPAALAADVLLRVMEHTAP